MSSRTGLHFRLIMPRPNKIVTNLWVSRLLLVLLFATGWPLVVMGQSVESTRKENAFRVVGYLPDYRVSQFDPVAAANLTELILFSAELTSKGTLDMSRLQNVPWQRLAAIRAQHPLRLTLCIGGWERSDGFAAISKDADLRRVFVADCLAVCQSRNLDGIDIDWEHPKNEQEQAGYGVLLSELQQMLHSHGLQLSMTMAAWQSVPPSAFESVDWIQVMAYDHPGKHSTIENAKADIERLKMAGAPASKLTLGIPFYGRDIVNASRTKTYRDIVAEYRPSENVDEVDGFYFNGPRTIANKIEYVKESGMAGVMVWEIGQDVAGEKSLLHIINQRVRSDVIAR